MNPLNDPAHAKKDFSTRRRLWQEHVDQVLNIDSYITDGFEKVCDVEPYYSDWKYVNINQDLMYADHKSWVYFVVENKTIVKCGETGNPLGIRDRYGVQPVGNSSCRFGRLSKGDGTDAYIRRSLYESIKEGNQVSLWAKKCKIQTLSESFYGKQQSVDTSIHKSLEQMYLNHFKEETGGLPVLNKASK